MALYLGVFSCQVSWYWVNIVYEYIKWISAFHKVLWCYWLEFLAFISLDARSKVTAQGMHRWPLKVEWIRLKNCENEVEGIFAVTTVVLGLLYNFRKLVILRSTAFHIQPKAQFGANPDLLKTFLDSIRFLAPIFLHAFCLTQTPCYLQMKRDHNGNTTHRFAIDQTHSLSSKEFSSAIIKI